MAFVNCRVNALVLAAASLVATYAIAQAPSSSIDDPNSNQQTDEQADQQSDQRNDNAQQADPQNQNQTSSALSSDNAQQDANQTNQPADNSQNQTNRDSAPALEPPKNQQPSERDNSARSGEQDQRGAVDARSRSSADDRRDSAQGERDRADAQYDNRNGERDRSDRVDQRNTDDRSTRTDQSLLRDQSSSRRDEMRGPDMGLWFNRSSRDGLVIADVAPRGAIAKLGFREGDRIVSVNGRRVASEPDFMDFVFNSNAQRVDVVVFRDGHEHTIVVEPAVLTAEPEVIELNPLERFGIILDDRYDDRIVVWRVIPRSPAYYAGFRPGDVIASFSGQPYRTRTEFETSVGTWNPGEANVQVHRGDRTRQLWVDVPVFDRGPVRSARRAERMERNDSNQAPNTRRGIFNGGILRGRGNR